MEFAFYTLTIIVLLLGQDGKPVSFSSEVHPVPFLSNESCTYSGEEWSASVFDSLDPKESWMVKFKCSPGISTPYDMGADPRYEDTPRDTPS